MSSYCRAFDSALDRSNITARIFSGFEVGFIVWRENVGERLPAKVQRRAKWKLTYPQKARRVRNPEPLAVRGVRRSRLYLSSPPVILPLLPATPRGRKPRC